MAKKYDVRIANFLDWTQANIYTILVHTYSTLLKTVTNSTLYDRFMNRRVCPNILYKPYLHNRKCSLYCTKAVDSINRLKCGHFQSSILTSKMGYLSVRLALLLTTTKIIAGGETFFKMIPTIEEKLYVVKTLEGMTNLAACSAHCMAMGEQCNGFR